MGQHYVCYTKHISRSTMAKNPLVCKLYSEWSKFYLGEKPDHQKTKYSDYIIFLTQLHLVNKSFAYIM